jgi:predicted AAA+ superfamily ATPase
MKYIDRYISSNIKHDLKHFPSVAILGPRQCGKSTLVRHILKDYPDGIYLDLENPDDLIKLQQPTLFFREHENKLICLDEIQRAPELFPILRSTIDARNRNNQFLILGSASPDLLRQSSETLAGRIVYQYLTPFLISELPFKSSDSLPKKYWVRGGFPRSYLAADDQVSLKWRESFIQTFLERDIRNMGISYPATSLRRLWQMLAHVQGQIVNLSQLGGSLGVSHTMVRHYLDVLEQTFMVRILKPFHGNLKKRLVKSPKVYIRDAGILHALLKIENFDMLLSHPVAGSSWETLVIENILGMTDGFTSSFYRTANGSEIDLVLEKGNKRYAVECKFSTTPKLSAGFFHAVDDLKTEHAWVVAPVDDVFPIKENVTVAPVSYVIDKLTSL